MKARRILSVLCIVALVISQGTISAMSLNDDEPENTEVQDVQKTTIDEAKLIGALTVEEKIYDGKTTANISVDASNLFSDDEGVSLSFNAEYDSPDAGVNKTISITDIKVIGENANKYELERNWLEIKNQTINRLPITLTPNDENSDGTRKYHSITDGKISESIGFKQVTLDEQTAQLLNNDGYVVNNNLSAYIVKYSENDVVKYGYSFNKDKMSSSQNAKNSNYVYIIDPDATPMVGDAAAPRLLPAIVISDNDANISEVDNIGIVSNGDVKLKLSASANNNKSSVFFTVKRKMPGEDSYSTIVESMKVENAVDTDQNNRFVYSTEEITISFPENTGYDDVDLLCVASVSDRGYTFATKETALQYSMNDSEKEYNHLIIDKETPSVKPDDQVKLLFDNTDRKLRVSGTIVDNGSGIQTIEYGLDKNNLKTLNYNFAAERTTSFDLRGLSFSYDEVAKHLTVDETGTSKIVLYLRVVDNVGITFEPDADDKISAEDARDTKAPKIRSISLESNESTGDKILHVLSFGLYSNKKTTLRMVVDDDSECGKASDVSFKLIYGEKDNETILYERTNQSSGTEFTYEFEQENVTYNNLQIRLIDGFGNGKNGSISLKDALAKIQDSIEWKDSVSKNSDLTVDTQAPTIDVSYDSKEVDSTVKYYYNTSNQMKDNNKIVAAFNDNYALRSLNVEANGNIVYTADYSEAIKTDAGYTIDLSGLDNGDYKYSFVLIDAAGNEAKKDISFVIDYKQPEGSLSVEGATQIDGDNWIKYEDIIKSSDSDEETENVKGIPVVFEFKEYDRPFERATFTVNGLAEKIVINAGTDSVTVSGDTTIVETVIDTKKYELPENHVYRISVDAETKSGNKCSADYELHVDRQVPTIECIEVVDYEKISNEIISVLPFGVFFHKTIELRVYADDSDGAGIDGVGINTLYYTFEGLKAEDGSYSWSPMNYSEEGEYYYCHIPENTQIFQDNIMLKAEDKLGRTSGEMPNIENTNPENRSSYETNFVMIETVVPNAILTFPKLGSDYVDGEYRINGTDRTIKLEASDNESGLRSVSFKINGNIISIDKNDQIIYQLDVEHPDPEKKVKVDYEFDLNTLLGESPEDGRYELTVEVVDNAGNVTNVSKVFYLDTTSPVITGMKFSPASTNGKKQTSGTLDENSEWIDELGDSIIKTDYGYYFKEDFNVNVTATDNPNQEASFSGLDYVILTLYNYDTGDQTEVVRAFNGATNEAFTISSGFKGIIIVQAVDHVDNHSDRVTPRAFVHDTSVPEIIIMADESGNELPETPLEDFNNNKLYAENVTFTVTIRDKQSGLKTVSYSSDSEGKKYTNSDQTEIPEITIDESGKRITPSLDNNWFITDTDLNIVTEIQRTFTYGELQNALADDRSIVAMFSAVDNSGNESVKETQPFTIDRTNPEVVKVEYTDSDGNTVETNKLFTESDELVYGYYFDKTVTITATINDTFPASGIQEVVFHFVSCNKDEKTEYATKTQPVIVKNAEEATAECEVPVGFKGQIYIMPIDKAQNKPAELTTEGVVVEQDAPQITIDELASDVLDDEGNPLYDDEGNLLYNHGSVKISVTISDPVSGLNSISHKTTSENKPKENEITQIIDNLDQKLKNGWIIQEMDHNLITKATRVFTFDDDDKGISMSFRASDRSSNTTFDNNSQSFTIDTTAPEITKVSFSSKTSDNDVEAKGFITDLEYGYYFQKAITLTVDLSDPRPSSAPEMVVFHFVPYQDGEKLEEKDVKVIVENITTTNSHLTAQATCHVEQGYKGQIYVTPYDRAGNHPNAVTTQAYVVENNAPQIKITPLPPTTKRDDLNNKLYTDTVSFTVTISDTESGLREITYVHSSDQIKNNASAKAPRVLTIDNKNDKYEVGNSLEQGWKITKIDENLITEVSQTFTFSKNNNDKNIFMTFKATDRSNNASSELSTEKFTIDTVLPTVEKFIFRPSSVDDITEANQDEFIQKMEYGYYFKKPFVAVVTAKDSTPSSGLKHIIFHLKEYNEGKMVSDNSFTVPIKDGQASYTIPEGFKGQILARAYDNAINYSPEQTPQAFVVDETAPVVTIEPLPDSSVNTDMDGNKLYNGEVKFRVTVRDEKSGLRDIIYKQDSEKNTSNDIITNIENAADYSVGDSLSNGWQITKMDNNLVTEVLREFVFNDDDNAVVISINASDRSMNRSETSKSEAFTIDRTSPIVRITYDDPVNVSYYPVNVSYYKGTVAFTMTVTERNFDPELMISGIEIADSYRNNQPNVSFSKSQSNENTYVAQIVFSEGDYTFRYSGEDRAKNRAVVYDRDSSELPSFFDKFNVDDTAPAVDVSSFANLGSKDTENYFNKKQSVTIKVDEHNWLAEDMNVVVEHKAAGSGHNSDQGWSFYNSYVRDWDKSLSASETQNNPDHHELTFEIDKDDIYRVSVEPSDRAGNKAVPRASAIFEIDTTIPELVSRNGIRNTNDGFVVSPYLMIYGQEQEKDPAPSVSFYDLNFEKLEITTTVFKPEFINDKEMISMTESKIFNEVPLTTDQQDFTLEGNFDGDGVYIISYVAYDKAGNKCKEVSDTYFKMINTDILAYIADSDEAEKTGYYSLMTSDGKSISKKATDINDLTISIVTKSSEKDAYSVVIRDENQEFPTNDIFEYENISETAVRANLKLSKEYFSSTFKDDNLDGRMYLTVMYNNKPYDLATIHIDNEKPTATLPEDFRSWNNYLFTSEKEIVLTDISETLDESATKVYECPRDGERTEIPYKYDKDAKTLSFTLNKGLHNIDITLTDEAGNAWNIERVTYLRVGNFRLYLGIGIGLLIVAIVVVVIVVRKQKYKKKTA